MHASGSPPRGLHSHVKGTPRGSGGHGPQPRCSRVGQLLMGVPGEVEALDRINLSFTLLLCVFSPPKRNIMVFETLIGGHFGEDAIFLSCDALSSLDLGHFVPTVHSPSLPCPHPSSGAPAPGPPGPNVWERSGGCRGVPAIVHSQNLWALKANFLLKFLYSLKLFY